MKQFLKRWGHGLLVLYGFIYMPCFSWLEANVTEYCIIHNPIDDLIPFCEYFIWIYFFWFFFVGGFAVFFFFRSQAECIRFGAYLIIGISIALITYFVFPNGLPELRPTEFTHTNYSTKLVQYLYESDTPTNVFPSLHAYNTLAVLVAVFHSKQFGKFRNAVRIVCCIIGALIFAATLFLKQHSIYDLLFSIAMAAAFYPLIYRSKLFRNPRWW